MAATDTGPQGFETLDVDGREICFWQTGSGDRPLLVLHTLRTQIEYAERIAPLLARDYRIVVPDLPGFGRSSKQLDRPYDATLFVDTMTAFIERLDLKGLTLLGESIGGTIALCLAANMPERLERVFAFNPHDGDGPLIGGQLGSLISVLGAQTTLPFRLEFAALLRWICLAAFADPDHLDNGFVMKLCRVPGRDRRFPKVMHSMLQHAASWSRLAEEKYPRIPATLPVEVVYGERDWAPPSAARRNRERLPEHVAFALLPDTGHWSFLDNPTGVVDIVNAVGDD